jgi:hypothetical protein
MRKPVLALFILGALLFDLSLALQPEDLPDTPYDESQGVACEHSAPLLTQVLQDSVRKTQQTGKSASLLLLGFPTRRGENRVEKRERPGQPNFDTPTIRSVPLRC